MSTRSCISPVRPSRAGLPRNTSDSCGPAGSVPRRSLPASWRACRTDLACWCARRRSATTGTTVGTRCSRRTAHAVRDSWPSWSRSGRRRRSRRPPPACGSCTCGRASCSPPAGPASGFFVRCSQPGSGDPSHPDRSGCRGSASTTSSMSSVERSPTTSSVARSTPSHQTPSSTATMPRALAHVLRRPALLSVPAVGPRLLLGSEGAQEMVQASQRVDPARLRSAGHTFRHPTLEACLRHQLGHIEAEPADEELGMPS